MSISDKFIHDFYSTIDEYMDKFVSQQISKEEFLSAFEKHCEANKDTVSLEDFGELSRRGWTCSNEKYSDEDYKKLVSAFDEVMYMKPDVSRKAAEKALNDDNYQNPVRSRIFEGYSMFPTRTAQIAAKALYSIADNPRHEKVLIDFYNENQRKINETSIERYGWYDGHFNYEYGLAHEMQSLERETEYEEARVERVEKKGALAKKITDKIQELKDKSKTDKLEDVPHAKTQILREIAKENIGKPARHDKWLVGAAIKEATKNFRK